MVFWILLVTTIGIIGLLLTMLCFDRAEEHPRTAVPVCKHCQTPLSDKEIYYNDGSCPYCKASSDSGIVKTDLTWYEDDVIH